jgi:hypothetical protein
MLYNFLMIKCVHRPLENRFKVKYVAKFKLDEYSNFYFMPDVACWFCKL